MVCVLPDPVWPYAIIVQLKPLSESLISGRVVVSKMSS